LFTLVLLPFLKSRADLVYTRLSGELGENDELSQQEVNILDLDQIRQQQQFQGNILRTFIKLYPYFHAFYEELCLFINCVTYATIHPIIRPGYKSLGRKSEE